MVSPSFMGVEGDNTRLETSRLSTQLSNQYSRAARHRARTPPHRPSHAGRPSRDRTTGIHPIAGTQCACASRTRAIRPQLTSWVSSQALLEGETQINRVTKSPETPKAGDHGSQDKLCKMPGGSRGRLDLRCLGCFMRGARERTRANEGVGAVTSDRRGSGKGGVFGEALRRDLFLVFDVLLVDLLGSVSSVVGVL